MGILCVTWLGFSDTTARHISRQWNRSTPDELTRAVRSLIQSGHGTLGRLPITADFATQYIHESEYTGQIISIALEAIGIPRGRTMDSPTLCLFRISGTRAIASAASKARQVEFRHRNVSLAYAEALPWTHQAFQCAAASLAGRSSPLLILGIECIGSSSLYGEMANAWFSAQPGGPKARGEFSVGLG